MCRGKAVNKKQQKRFFNISMILSFLVLSFLFIVFLWNAQMRSVDILSKNKQEFIRKVENYKSSSANNDKEKDILILEKDILVITKDETSAKNAVYTNLIPAVGGLFFWITAYMTWRNLVSSEEKQITERFSKAVEQLGSEKSPTVIGAIYSLERISKDSEKDYQKAMEILIAFIKNNNSIDDHQNQLAKVHQSIQEVITIVGRRTSNPNRDINEKLDVSYVNLTKISILNLDLSKIDFRGSCFTHGNINGAKFIDSNLTDSNFSYVNEKSIGTRERNEFTKADLRGANFHKAVLIKSDFRNARMVATDLTNAQLSNSNMIGANLVGANMDEADLTGANLREVNLSGASLNNTIISGADLSTAKGLTVDQIKKAKYYKDAKYDNEFAKKLSI
jgi:uncharacterized protein YjbI with pentapeptide repeats/competence protein ComGC